MIMDLTLKFGLIWLAINILLVATAWYGFTTLRRHFPDWWRRTIADKDPEASPLIKVRVSFEPVETPDQQPGTVRYLVNDPMTVEPNQSEEELQPMPRPLQGGMAANENR
jgi:hypothetical protein